MNALLNSTLAAPLQSVSVSAAERSQFNPIILYGVFTLLLIGPIAFGAVDPWAIFLVEAGAAALLLVWILQQARLQEVRAASNPVFTPMGAFAALGALQYLAKLSAYRYATGSAWLLLCAQGVLCFLITQSLQRTSQVKRLALAVTTYGFGVACFALLQSITSNGKIYWFRSSHGGWTYGPYVNHNHYAGLMELLVPIPLVICLTHFVRGRKRAMAALAGSVMAASVFLSGSRGGMAAITVQIAALIIFALRRENQGRHAWLAIAAFAAVTFGLLAWIGGGNLVDRLTTIQSEARMELTGGTRITIDRDGLRMFAQKPVLGWGLGTFPEVYPRFQSFYTDFFVNAAHNDYLQLLVETGLVGFAIMLWLLVTVFRGASRKLENWASDTNGAVALATTLSVTGLLVHSLVDFNLQIPANATLFYVMCSLAAMNTQFGKSRRRAKTNDLIEEMIRN